jgi:hypothetical protein
VLKQRTRGGRPAHLVRGKHDLCERTTDRGDPALEACQDAVG